MSTRPSPTSGSLPMVQCEALCARSAWQGAFCPPELTCSVKLRPGCGACPVRSTSRRKCPETSG